MKIGILGSGYIGQAAAAYWKGLGHEVTVTTRRPEKIADLARIADHVYLLNDTLEPFIESQEALLVCLAPSGHTLSDYTAAYLDTASRIHRNLLRFPSLRHLLYTGSTSVYGDCGGNRVDEETPADPATETGKILLQTETLFLRCQSSGVNVCIFRCGEIYGPEREIQSRLRRMSANGIPGTGENRTNIVHREDVVRALDFALVNRLKGIYNLCSDFHEKRRDFYDRLCAEEQLPPVRWNPTLPNLHGGNRIVSGEKLKRAGFTFTRPLFNA